MALKEYINGQWVQVGTGFIPAPPPVPTGISQAVSYNGTMLNIQAVPAFYAADPALSAPFVFWQKSTDGKDNGDSTKTWFGNDGTSATTFPGNVMQHPLTSTGVVRFRARTENASGVPSAWFAQTTDTAYAPPPFLLKRRILMYFYPPSTTADTAPNQSQPGYLPASTGGAVTSWKPSGPAKLHTINGTSTATTFQCYFGPAGAAFGAGTAILSAALSDTGTGNEDSSTTTFTAAALAGIPSDSEVCPKWAAQAVAGTYAVMQFEEV